MSTCQSTSNLLLQLGYRLKNAMMIISGRNRKLEIEIHKVLFELHNFRGFGALS